MWKHKTESAINLAGLSIGMTAAVLIMLWVQNEWSYDSYHPKVEQVYRITNHVPITPEETWVWENSPFPLTEIAKKEIPDIEALAFISAGYGTTFNIRGELFKEKKAANVSPEWFDLFKYEFVSGSPTTFFQAPFNMAMTESAARRYFGKAEPIGQLVKIDTINYQVTAILKDAPTNSSFQYQVLMPMAAKHTNPKQLANDRQWGNFNHITFVRINPASDPKQVSAKLTQLLDNNRKENRIKTTLLPIREMHFDNTVQNTTFTTGSRQAVYVFAILAVLILVVACINYVNLTTARASMRAKEVSIRKIVGAARGSLFGQFIAESLFTGFIALLITVALVQLSLPFFNHITGQPFKLPLTSANFWLLMAGTIVAVTLLTGIYPALLLSSFKPLSLFKGGNILQLKDVTLRKVLVTTQFAVSVMLIAATLIIYKQLEFIRSQNTGYNRSQVLTFTLPWKALEPYRKDNKQVISFHNRLQQQLLAIPGIEKVTTANESVLSVESSSAGNTDWAGRAKDYEPSMVRLSGDETFPSFFGLELASGRWFRPQDENDAMNSFILNETAIKQLKIHQPAVGQYFKFNGDSGQIVGVVKDFHFRSLHTAISPLVYHIGDDWRLYYYLKVSPQSIASVIPSVEKIWKSTVNGVPFEYEFLNESFEKQYRAENRMSTLMIIFAGIAIFISCLGLLGLAAFTAERRTKEIGIRKVLGASVASIITLLSREFLLLVFIGGLIAVPIAWWAMNKWLEGFAYRVSLNLWTFATAGILVLLITLVIVGLHSLRAASSNPTSSLRNE